jgi:hypothetical protein
MIRVVNNKVSISTSKYGLRSHLEATTDERWEDAGDDMKKLIFMQVLVLRLLERNLCYTSMEAPFIR